MLKTNVYIADPYNDNHINLYSDFEKEANIENGVTPYLLNIKKTYQKKQFHELEKNSNENLVSLFITNSNKMSDYCVIKYEKDRKIASVTYPEINRPKRKIIKASEAYVFDVLSLEEMFVSVSINDKLLIKDLEESEFESLGVDNGSIKFIKEKNLDNEIERQGLWK